jgi:hypothetical protein
MRLQIGTIKGIIIDLRVIEDSAAGLSNTAMAVLEQSPMANDTAIGQFLRSAMFAGMFFITVSYPIYSKLKSDD